MQPPRNTHVAPGEIEELAPVGSLWQSDSYAARNETLVVLGPWVEWADPANWHPDYTPEPCVLMDYADANGQPSDRDSFSVARSELLADYRRVAPEKSAATCDDHADVGELVSVGSLW